MPNEILDQPIKNDFPKIRKPYSSILEYTILITNGIFIIFGVAFCWSIAFSERTWLFLVNPTVFILLFGIAPFHFVYKWQKASSIYDTTQSLRLLKELSNHLAIFLAPVILALWLLLFFFFSGFLTDVNTWTTSPIESYSTLFIRFLIFFPFLILGPLQFFFIRKANKINKKLTTS